MVLPEGAVGQEVRPLKIGLFSPFFGSTIGGGEKYLGVTAEAIRDAFPTHTVEIVSPLPVDVSRYVEMLGLDLTGLSFRSGDLHAVGVGRRLRRLPVVRRYADLYLAARAVAWTRDYDLFLSMVYVMPAFSRARRGVILCQFPYEVARSWPVKGGIPPLLYKAYSAPYYLLKRLLLGSEAQSFQLIICQSDYVRGWVNRYWGRESLVVNPPIDIPDSEPDMSAKQRIILSVGRFFASGHSKRHDVMIETFRRLCDKGLRGWELHLVGSLQRSNPADLHYFERVRRLAEGYPVCLHTDAPRAALQALYRKASIYWHAAGYGVDAKRRPIDLEHFGMTTAEAMGYGVVPVVIGRGGQVELVRNGLDGFLWQDTDQLLDLTFQLVHNENLRYQLGLAARQSSFRFSRAEFKRGMVMALQPLIAELESGIR
jgi:glycosyltransferase involved in cell wall biosynthesis